LQACGWSVLRFGAADVYRHPDRVIATVRTALAAAPQS
jgi:very-short-patch-repair endonuclease